MLSRRTASNLGWALLLLFCATPVFCVPRESAEATRKRLEALEKENFQLRKDLAEARVRLEMQMEKAGCSGKGSPDFPTGTAAKPVGGRAPAAVRPAPADSGPSVVYSEPITDASRFTSSSGASPTVAPSRLMRSARESLDARDPAGAQAMFQQVVTRYRDDALADDAQFGVGECYFQMGRYEEAIAEYRKVVNDFPFGDQVPFAFLKIGFAYLAQEQRDLALDNFKTVSEAYPGTEAATIARQQIAHLSRQSLDAAGRKAPAEKP